MKVLNTFDGITIGYKCFYNLKDIEEEDDT